jgi:nucleotide-binding universal stress UspA family protein
MSISFKSILIPVDFSINTEVAIKKGLVLAERGTVIHLLHVHNYLSSGLPTRSLKYFVQKNSGFYYKEAEDKLMEWKDRIEEENKDIEVVARIRFEGSIQKTIEETAKKLHPDLIIIGKNSHHSWFPFLNTLVPNKIVKNTGISVLTVKPGAVNNDIRTVLVPISTDATKDKMEVISAFCRKFRVKIHLVTFRNKESVRSGLYASSLLQMYQLLKTSTNCSVEYAVLYGGNKAKAILNYAKKINADILLVHPETETKIGWPNKHISDVLPTASKVQVLTIHANTLVKH